MWRATDFEDIRAANLLLKNTIVSHPHNYFTIMNMRKYIGVIAAVLLLFYYAGRRFIHSGGVNTRSNTRVDRPSSIEGLDRNTSHLILTRHARCRMECRHINSDELKEILHDGSLNEQKTQQDSRGKKYALEGYTHEHQHLRVVFAPEQDGVVVVTCIDLDNEWACPDCK
ncbi:MAG: hypothetical protein NVS3B19_07050 [Ginsengibacter sp.]